MAKRKKEVRLKVGPHNPVGSIKVPSYADPLEVARTLQRNVKQRTPRKTGEARAAWHVDIKKNGNVWVVNTKDYIRALDHGHSRQAPQGFSKQAIKTARSVMQQDSPTAGVAARLKK